MLSWALCSAKQSSGSSWIYAVVISERSLSRRVMLTLRLMSRSSLSYESMVLLMTWSIGATVWASSSVEVKVMVDILLRSSYLERLEITRCKMASLKACAFVLDVRGKTAPIAEKRT